MWQPVYKQEMDFSLANLIVLLGLIGIFLVWLNVWLTPFWMLLLLSLLLLLAVRLFMDIHAALIILAPVLGPLTTSIGMNPVHAGIMIVLALNISLMTPPVGACLFVMSSVTGERIEKISYALIPFLIVEVLVLFLVAFWDDLTLFIPRLLM